MKALMRATVGRDGVNYLVTNHIPRRLATRAMGWFSRVEQPLVARLSLAIWRAAAGDALHLDEAERRLPQHPRLLHAHPEAGRARSIAAPASPSARATVVVAAGRIAGTTLVRPRASPTRSTICCRIGPSPPAVVTGRTSRCA